ncbi:hypothetical protein G7Z17_g6369 [Cylindrodendrum hubeiense]|uniref:Amidoligase enzyme n=1 Tax=Cylindrodendrum hubeiense TaxID=595255 RepID=A0A9P5HFC1_9HYPO|nr:hypothetical protein G7Z17_g6369 [Cylindrodendrum hubeiense]
MSIPDSVSLGVEVEFLSAQQRDSKSQIVNVDYQWICGPPSEDPYAGKSPEGPYYWAEMASVLNSCKVLESEGLPTGCPFPTEPDLKNPITKDAPADSILELPDASRIRVWNRDAVMYSTGSISSTRANYWFMVRERHISVDVRNLPGKSPSDEYNWHGTELNSPVLTRPNEFKNKLPSLKRSLNAIQNNMKVALNASCGLHLHVNDSGKLHLDTAKRVACLVLLLEDPLLYKLSHPSRSKSPYSVRISTDSKAVLGDESVPCLVGDGLIQTRALRDLIEKFKGRKMVSENTLKAMERIYFMRDQESLRTILKKYDEGPVHTTRRCALVVSRNDTIEFRYPASTFNSEYIAAWGQLVRHIYALTMKSPLEFSKILCHVYEVVTRDEAVGWEAVMEAIEFRDVGPEQWKKWIAEFDGPLKDLDQQGIMPRRPRMTID